MTSTLPMENFAATHSNTGASGQSLRIMQVVSNLEIGGGQEVVRTLVENLAEIGSQPVVCTFEDGPLRQEIEGLGIPVEILPVRRHSILALPWFLLEMVRMRAALREVVRRYDIEIAQTQLLRVHDFLVLSLRYRSDLRVFWTFQNAHFTLRADHLTRHKWLLGPKRAVYRWLYHTAAHWVNGFIAVSDDVKAALMKDFSINSDDITVICNSVDVRRYQQSVDRIEIRTKLGLPPDACIVSVIATFKRQKGHRYLIEAAAPVVKAYPNVHILFVGDGELREVLQEQVSAADMTEHIHFLGFRQDIPDLLAASDYFVLPSLWEGLPMALIEAMAAGLPVVATDVSGSRQVVVNGETGLLVAPGDAQALANALQQLLSQPQRARAMGLAAQRRVTDHFGAKKQAADHLALFQAQQETLQGGSQ